MAKSARKSKAERRWRKNRGLPDPERHDGVPKFEGPPLQEFCLQPLCPDYPTAPRVEGDWCCEACVARITKRAAEFAPAHALGVSGHVCQRVA